MRSRNIESIMLSEGTKYPVITVVGPRQSGKTTLCKKLFPTYTYVNLEQMNMRHFANTDPAGFFQTYKPPIILDEIQNCPNLLSQVQVLSDELSQDAQFVLTGSQQLTLSQAISQSLAGRTCIFTLLPFSLKEINSFSENLSWQDLVLNGGMPRLYEKSLTPESYYRDYIQTYLEKDVRNIMNIKNLSKFELFLTLLAGRTGQLINLSSLSNDVGVSSTTLNEWLTVLETSHIIFKLNPWFSNIGKRLTKSSKIYFTDTGVACSLLGITTKERLNADSLRGNLFENLVILEALKNQFNKNQKHSLYFLRTESGIEIDLLNKQGEKLIPYEIKSASSIVDDFFVNIEKASKFLPNLEKEKGCIIYTGENLASYKGYKVINFNSFEL